MRLLREWNGSVHVVTVDEAKVIHWNGRTWRSLSEVARAITGTATSIGGPPMAILYQHQPPKTIRTTLAVYFLAGGKPRQAVPVKLLRQYATEYAGLDEWLFDECYHAVGDLAETIAHILPAPKTQSDIGLATWIEQRIEALRGE